jgi:hypothetical protein
VYKRIRSAVKRVQFITDGMLYIKLTVYWCDMIVLKVLAKTENKSHDMKTNFIKNQIVCIFNKFQHHMRMSTDLNENVARENIFTIRLLRMIVYTKLMTCIFYSMHATQHYIFIADSNHTNKYY